MGKLKRRVLEPGNTVLNNKYEILKVIHTSGMANVYLVSDKNLKKQWCLKEIVKSEAGRNMVEYRSLIQEANIMKSLNHSGIPRIVTIEEEGDSIFIIMDYVDGLSVKNWLQRKGTIAQPVVVNWMRQVCSILIYLHNRKDPIFYRDMKPDNIMIQEDGNIKVLDFGISVVITEDNAVIKEALGTRGYAAPEQRKVGSKYDLRSDIYALGKTMYSMLTGLDPSIIKILKPLRQVDSSLSMGLEVIIDKCTRDNPNERYQSVEEVLYALQNYEKLDINYRKKARRKVNVTIGLFLVSLMLILGSFIPLTIDNNRLEDLYSEKVSAANQSGRFYDYVEAISYKPEKVEPYFGLIDAIKVDGIFSKDEEKVLLGLINPNLSDIKKDKNYGELALNMGKLYWYFYEGDDGNIVSVKWFQEAIDSNFAVDEAKIYYDMGSFKRNISMSIAQAEDAGMYKEYWDNLIMSKENANGEIIELQVYNSIADAISTYAYRLLIDGVSKEDMEAEISNIKKYLSSVNPVSEKSKELYDRLSNISGTLYNKLDMAYLEEEDR